MRHHMAREGNEMIFMTKLNQKRNLWLSPVLRRHLNEDHKLKGINLDHSSDELKNQFMLFSCTHQNPVQKVELTVPITTAKPLYKPPHQTATGEAQNLSCLASEAIKEGWAQTLLSVFPVCESEVQTLASIGLWPQISLHLCFYLPSKHGQQSLGLCKVELGRWKAPESSSRWNWAENKQPLSPTINKCTVKSGTQAYQAHSTQRSPETKESEVETQTHTKHIPPLWFIITRRS